MRGDGGGSGTGDGGGAAGTVARWRGEADGEAAWWSGLRGSVVQKHVVWEADDEESRGRGTGERRPDPRGGVRSPGGKAADRVCRTRGSGLPNSDKFGHGPKLPRGSVPWKTRGFGVPK
jgi:hypothetical protein